MAGELNLVRFNPTLGGTTDWTFSTIVAGHATPAQAGAVNGRLYKVHSFNASGSEWELSEGAYNSATGVFARTTILYNSAGTGTATGQSGAGTKINFTTVPQCAVVLLKEDLLLFDEANAFSTAQKAQARTNIAAFLKGHIFGLTLSTAGSSATFGIAAGEAADSTGVDLMELASAYTKTTSSWAVGTATGSLDTGAIANSTWYHAYLIKRVDTGVVDVLVSLSATAPTMPTNYTLFRRIGSMKTNGSAQWTKFIQDGDRFMWDVPVGDVNVTNPGTAAVTRTMSTPLGVRVRGILIVAFDAVNMSTDGVISIYISDLSQADSALTAAVKNVQLFAPSITTEVAYGGVVEVMTNTSSQVRSRVAQSTASTTFFMNTNGWVDDRGRTA